MSPKEEVLHKTVLALPVEIAMKTKTEQQLDRLLKKSVKTINKLYERNNVGAMEEGCKFILMDFLEKAIPIMKEYGSDFFKQEEYYELAVEYAHHLTKYYEEFQN